MRTFKSDYFPRILLEKHGNGSQTFLTTLFWTIKPLKILSRTNGKKRKTQGVFVPIPFHEEEGK